MPCHDGSLHARLAPKRLNCAERLKFGAATLLLRLLTRSAEFTIICAASKMVRTAVFHGSRQAGATASISRNDALTARPPGPIAGQQRILGRERQIFSEGLCEQNAVESILMIIRQVRESSDMEHADDGEVPESERLRVCEAPTRAYGCRSAFSPIFDPSFGFFIAHWLPPFVSRRNERILAGDAEREPLRASCRNQFSDRLTMAGNDNRFSFLDQFQQPGQLRLGLMHIDLHGGILA